MTRDEKQDGIIAKWLNMGGLGSVIASTGFGKSYLLNKVAKRKLTKFPDAVIHYIVHSKVMKKQVEAQVDSKVEVFIINSYIKKQRECDLLLVDECDLMAATTFSKIFKVSKYKHILCATASLERKDGKHILIQKYAPVIDNIGFKECLENGWICDFEIKNIAVERPLAYELLDNSFRRDFAYFHDDLDIVFSCMGYPGAKEFLRQTNLDNTVGEVIGIAKRCRQNMQDRNELIYECDEKLQMAKQLILDNPDKKIITFSMSKKFANTLTEMIPGSICIDSDMTDKVRNKLIQEFQEGKHRVLNSIKIFERGFDAPEVDMGIVCSTTSVDRRAKQVIGRMLRYVFGKKAIIYFLYLKETKEKWTLMNAQKDIPNISWI